jgi:hypothetical protein
MNEAFAKNVAKSFEKALARRPPTSRQPHQHAWTLIRGGQSVTAETIAVASLSASIVSIVVTGYFARRSTGLFSRQTEILAQQAQIQSRMLALENVRQRAETRATKRAQVTGAFRKFDERLIIRNDGPAIAKNVRFTLDGKPPSQHEVWLGGVSDEVIQMLGQGNTREYLLGLAQQSPDKLVLEIIWENPDGEVDTWATEIGLF